MNTIEKGSIFIYRTFDVAGSISLIKAEELLTTKLKSRFKLNKDPYKSVILKEAPLMVTLGDDMLEKYKNNLKVRVKAKLWNYGVVSICLEVGIPENINFSELIKLGAYLDDAEEVDNLAKKHLLELSNQLMPAFKNFNIWDTFEDYQIYVIEKVKTKTSPQSLIKELKVSNLILGEDLNISNDLKKEITGKSMQYAEEDLLLIDWNSALVVDFSENKSYQDYVDMIELSLVQLLEFRFYDNNLDKKLSEVMETIQKLQVEKKPSMMDYKKTLIDARRIYVDFSDIFERIDNSLKVVGDFYLATIYRITGSRLKIEDWKRDTQSKLKRLKEMMEVLENEMQLIQNSRDIKKSHLLELTIILLFFKDDIKPFLKWVWSLF